MSEKKTICIPEIPGEDSIVECCINGKNYTIKRGERVQIPAELHALLSNSSVMGERA